MTTESRKVQYRVSKQKIRAEKRAMGYVNFTALVLPEIKLKLVAYLKTLVCLTLIILTIGL